MKKIGWCKCPHCSWIFKTNAKIGNRIKCRREACGRTFIVKMKLDKRI